MNTIFRYFQSRKWLLMLLVAVTFGLSVWGGMRCKLEENIFKLLPKAETSADVPDLAFSNIRLKDKVFVQVIEKQQPTDGTDATAEETNDGTDATAEETNDGEEATAEETNDGEVQAAMMAEAMDAFLAKAVELDREADGKREALNAIESTLGEIDILMLLDAGNYLVEHGSAYLDFEDEWMDSLTTEEHIREQVAWYIEMAETDLGANCFDLMASDPCGIVIAKGKQYLEDSQKTRRRPTKDPRKTHETCNENAMKMRTFQANHIFSQDGQACIGFITPSFGTEDSKKASKLIKNLDKAKAEVEAAYPVTILYHGTVVLSGGNSQRIKKDIATTLGVSLLLIMLVLAWAFKRPTYWGLMLAPILYSIMLALGLVFAARGWMSFMALGIGAIVLGVAMSYCLHVMVHYVYIGDAERTVREQTKPVLMGSITTIGAFVGLMATNSSLLQDFGAFASLVIVGTTLFSLIAMPQFFPKHNDANRRAFTFLEKINSYEIDRKYWVVGIVLVWVAVCCCFSGRYTFDSNLRHINYVSPEVQMAMDSWNEKMNQGLNQQYYASVASSTDEALEQLPAIEQVVDSLREAGVVTNKIRISGMLPSLTRQEERNAHWEAYFTEDKQREVWNNIVRVCRELDVEASWFEPFQERMAMPAEPELVSETGLLPDEILSNFVETVDGQTMVYFPIKTTQEDAQAVKDILTKTDGCMVLDPYYYSTDLVELIHSDFTRIMLFSSLFVLLLLLVTYRNIWIALIVFVPMTLSWYTVLGAMALFGQPFNMINTVVSAFVFGIGVDYSIFIMDGLLHGSKKMMASHKSAITLSATALVTCMFSLLFAVHPSIHSIAFASLVGMITTMMLSYTVEPNLYRLYKKLKRN